MNKDKINISDYLISTKSKTNMPDIFYSSDNKETDKRVSEAITNRINIEFNDLFTGIGCFESMFSLHIKEGSFQYQGTARKVAYAVQKPLKKELEASAHTKHYQEEWLMLYKKRLKKRAKTVTEAANNCLIRYT